MKGGIIVGTFFVPSRHGLRFELALQAGYQFSLHLYYLQCVLTDQSVCHFINFISARNHSIKYNNSNHHSHSSGDEGMPEKRVKKRRRTQQCEKQVESIET